MKAITFDDIIYSLQRFGGASTYWREVTSRVVRMCPDYSVARCGFKGGVINRLASPCVGDGVFHSSHFRVAKGGASNVTTIHDLIYEKRLIGGKGWLLNMFERRRAIKNADAVIFISESTKRDGYEYYGDLLKDKIVRVVHHGSNARKIDGVDWSIAANGVHLDLSSADYFLYVGGRSGYKNFNQVLQSYSNGRFAEDGIKLICTGAEFDVSEAGEINRLGVQDNVYCVGNVDEGCLSILYQGAIALVYSSLYEGFGLPPLEAMMNDCPVIAANISSIPEVVGGAGILFEPGRMDALLEAMNAMLSEDMRKKCIDMGGLQRLNFSWDKSASQHFEVYKGLL